MRLRHTVGGCGRGRGMACLLAVLLVAGCAPEEETLPTFYRWGKIELIFQGPAMKGLGEPNPFAVTFDVMFTSPTGESFLVPGFYDGDGRGGLDGNTWKVRFSGDVNGIWSWHTQSSEPVLNGLRGKIGIVNQPVDAPDLYRLGRLEYVGQRYLKFREGGYWIKAGADEPENLLGKAFGSDDWAAKKRQIDYLSSVGVNSVYVMTHNLDGDGQDVWPWVGATQQEAKENHDRYDVAKLERWREMFEYIQSRGLVIQLVLEDDSAWTGYNYSQYYREIVARFGYLPAIYFNFGEEHNEAHSLEEALDYMELLETIDPYNHPRAVHNVNVPRAEYIDNPAITLTSIQTDPKKPATLNRLAVDWSEAPLARRERPLVVSFDEARPAEDRRSWWSVYLGGGVWEGLLRVQYDFAEFQLQWRELALARRFMETLPVERMFPANHLVTSGEAFCLASPGEFYALYLPSGGEVTVDLLAGNRYRYGLYNPRGIAGDPWVSESEVEGEPLTIKPPGEGDWAVVIQRISGEASPPPTAASAKVFSAKNEPVLVHLATLPADAAGGLTYEILAQPKSGRLEGKPPNVVYRPRPGFTGPDEFRWKASGPTGESNTATVTVICNATGENTPPRAYNQSVRVSGGAPETFILRYSDRDGPGPYRIFIRKRPDHGTIEGVENDITYTPEPGYAGRDRLEWEVSDGAGRSNRARVSILVRH